LGQASIPPIRVYLPRPKLVCPAGYSIWWPEGKEFENDRYAECVQRETAVKASKYTPAEKKQGETVHAHLPELKESVAQVAKK
jgi:hypothetical protein